jgi:hypothetical protein
MTIYDRLRRIGITEERLARVGVKPPEAVALTMPADLATAAADVEAWRAYRDASPEARIRLLYSNAEAIERGRALDARLPAEPSE